LAGNVATPTLGQDCGGNVASNGYNLIRTNCGVITTTGDLIGFDPVLGPLADNGGPTPTHALADGSPALDRIPRNTKGCGAAFFSDQRGKPRPAGSGCDIGAFELQLNLPPVDWLPLVQR